jgi:electron transfer flavoprotein beta subunit
MRIVVCVKEVPDPDAVNSYAVAGRLQIADDGRSLASTAITRLMNAYDEQAIEAALRLRDAGAECTITAVSAGDDPSAVLKHAVALGADDAAWLQADAAALDGAATAALLAAYLRQGGGADLVLCGRQASDDDQGVVPALLGEALGMPVVTVARAIALADGGGAVRVTRVTPNGDEVVEAKLPAVVTVSNELGQPRYPTAARSMAARKMKPETLTAADLGIDAAALRPRVLLRRMFVPQVTGDCEFIAGESAAALAQALAARLRDERLVP